MGEMGYFCTRCIVQSTPYIHTLALRRHIDAVQVLGAWTRGGGACVDGGSGGCVNAGRWGHRWDDGARQRTPDGQNGHSGGNPMDRVSERVSACIPPRPQKAEGPRSLPPDGRPPCSGFRGLGCCSSEDFLVPGAASTSVGWSGSRLLNLLRSLQRTVHDGACSRGSATAKDGDCGTTCSGTR